jgi:hypothetical protein
MLSILSSLRSLIFVGKVFFLDDRGDWGQFRMGGRRRTMWNVRRFRIGFRIGVTVTLWNVGQWEIGGG